MKIVVHNMQTYAHAQQLAKALAARGHEVAYLYCPSIRMPSLSSLSFAPADGVTVVPVALGAELRKRNFLWRVVQERVYGASAASLIAGLRPDLVISGDTTIEAQARIQTKCRRAAIPFVLWLTDIYSVGVKSVLSRVPVIGPVAALRYNRLERRVVQASDAIVAIADDFYDILTGWGADPDRLSVIENWAVLPKTAPPPKDNEWTARHGLRGKRVLLYSGTLGFKHNPQIFIDLATEFREDADIRIVVLSEGHGAELLSRRQREFPGLLVLPFQPDADFHKALATADVLLAILEPEAAGYSVPSKILTYMAAGRPILAAISAKNLAARTIVAASAGVTVDPGNVSELCLSARYLLDDEGRRTQLGSAALRYAQANFDIERIATRFESIFRRITAAGVAPAKGSVGTEEFGV